MPRKPLTIAFLALIFGVPTAQAAWELSRGERVQVLDVVGPLKEERLRGFEDALREASFLHRVCSPYYQWACLALGKGNEKAVLGRDGWIFLRDDLELFAGPGFLGEAEEGPLDAVVDLRDQLAERGVELLFVPVPAKSTVEPEHVSVWTRGFARPTHRETAAFLEALEERGVATVDLASVWPKAGDEPLYLARDTHWTPGTMAAAARAIADRAGDLLVGEAPAEESQELSLSSEEVEASGDLVGMLRLPEQAEPFEPMAFSIEQVVGPGGEFVRFDRSAEVLLLGDSFSGAFSDPRLGLGEHAGLGERLAFELDAPIDVIQIAGGGSLAVRESLARRTEGWARKRLVIWQVSRRELPLTDGRWQRVELPPWEPSEGDGEGAHGATDDGTGTEGSPNTETEGEADSSLRVLAEVVEVSRVPEEFDYEFCLAFYEYRVLEVRSGSLGDGPLWVAHVALEDYEDLPGAAYAVGERHLLDLADVWEHHDLEMTSFVDDTDAGRTIWFATRVREGE